MQTDCAPTAALERLSRGLLGPALLAQGPDIASALPGRAVGAIGRAFPASRAHLISSFQAGLDAAQGELDERLVVTADLRGRSPMPHARDAAQP